MRVWYHSLLGGEKAAVTVSGDRFSIGRGVDNQVVLSSHSVAELAIVVAKHKGDWQLESRGTNGCQLDGAQLYAGDKAKIQHGSVVQLYPFVLEFDLSAKQRMASERSFPMLESDAAKWLMAIQDNLLKRVDVGFLERAKQGTDDSMLRLEHVIDELAREVAPPKTNRAILIWYMAGQTLYLALVDSLLSKAPDSMRGWRISQAPWMKLVSAVAERERELSAMVSQMLHELGLDSLPTVTDMLVRAEAEFWERWESFAQSLLAETFHYLVHRCLKKQLKDTLFGYGPLEDLVRLPLVSEVMVVGKDKIYVEKMGKIERSGRRFLSDDVTLAIIERIVGQVGRRIDKSQPVVDARLSDGSRVHAVVPPIAIDGPCLTIRRFVRSFTAEELISNGTIPVNCAAFLRAAVTSRQCILVSGGTGSGKTTLLNCLASWIPTHERIVTIEDTCELQLQHEHVVRMETKLPNAEGTGAFVTRDLVRQALRMRPDRIVVGECRGAEALDMLQAMNTGHEGCLTTIHANSPIDVIPRLETMVQMAADLPIDAIQRQIVASIDLIVHVERMEGRRLITRIAEVAGLDPATRRIRIKELFRLEKSNQEWKLQPTGRVPSFADKLLAAGWFDVDGFQRSE